MPGAGLVEFAVLNSPQWKKPILHLSLYESHSSPNFNPKAYEPLLPIQ